MDAPVRSRRVTVLGWVNLILGGCGVIRSMVEMITLPSFLGIALRKWLLAQMIFSALLESGLFMGGLALVKRRRWGLTWMAAVLGVTLVGSAVAAVSLGWELPQIMKFGSRVGLEIAAYTAMNLGLAAWSLHCLWVLGRNEVRLEFGIPETRGKRAYYTALMVGIIVCAGIVGAFRALQPTGP